MSLSRAALAGLSIMVLLATSCTPAESDPGEVTGTPTDTVSSSATTSTSPSPSPSPTPPPSPSPSPTPTIKPTDLMPGTNHNYAAEAYSYPAATVQDWLRGNAEATEKIVFLTFDDGPNHSITPQVLEVLAAHHVPATFFVVGNVIDGAPDVLERHIAEGHAIALHSYTHDYKKLYPGRYADAERVGDEFDRTLAEVRSALNEDFSTGAWRYPGGHMSWKSMDAADEALAERGASWIDWNCMTGDAEPKSRRPTTVNGMVSMATAPIGEEGVNVSVMLAHDSEGKQLTVDSLPEIIEAYKSAGYSFGVIA